MMITHNKEPCLLSVGLGALKMCQNPSNTGYETCNGSLLLYIEIPGEKVIRKTNFELKQMKELKTKEE